MSSNTMWLGGERVTSTYNPGVARGSVTDARIRKGCVLVRWDAKDPKNTKKMTPIPQPVTTLIPLDRWERGER